MKMSFAGLAYAAMMCAQDNSPGQQKHLSVPIANSVQPLAVAAVEIDRGVQYPSILHLKGNVEIRMPVCVAIVAGSAQKCSGVIVFRADEVYLHEDMGQIEAKGPATVIREPK